MNKEITAALRSIGLTEFQADLYLAVLKNPIASVLELAKITGKNRQQIYNDGELLVTMGLLEKTSRQKRKYIASSPKKIIELAKEKEQKAKESLEKISLIAPELERLIGNYKTSISTKFYEGEAQIKEAYERELMLAKNTEVFSLVGEIEEVFKIFPEEYW